MKNQIQERRFTLRMNAAVFEVISALAKEHRRSTAKEIEQAIACYITKERGEEDDAG